MVREQVDARPCASEWKRRSQVGDEVGSRALAVVELLGEAHEAGEVVLAGQLLLAEPVRELGEAALFLGEARTRLGRGSRSPERRRTRSMRRAAGRARKALPRTWYGIPASCERLLEVLRRALIR